MLLLQLAPGHSSIKLTSKCSPGRQRTLRLARICSSKKKPKKKKLCFVLFCFLLVAAANFHSLPQLPCGSCSCSLNYAKSRQQKLIIYTERDLACCQCQSHYVCQADTHTHTLSLVHAQQVDNIWLTRRMRNLTRLTHQFVAGSDFAKTHI